MSQAVSVKFKNAQAAPANLPVTQVQLILGNYFSAAAYGTTITANHSDGSGNYPASGAIDGDRTDINAGPPSGADNGIGLSTWNSGHVPHVGDTDELDIHMTTQRTINRLTFYVQQGKGVPLSWGFLYQNSITGVPYTWVASTADIGEGQLLLGGNPHPVIDFPDITATDIKVVFASTYGNLPTSIAEIEVYRKVDITSRVKSVKISRQRDYKLANPLAATVTLDCINTDRFFSISHVPTAAEITAGFINQELKPNMQILVNMGFNTYGPKPELVPEILAYCDSITPKPKTRDCKMVGRDAMKTLINQTDSTSLKTNIELSQAIQYVLNRSNISTLDSNLGVTNIIIPYFFTDQEDHLTTIRNLTQAAGDSLFYFDENGIATFQFYTGNLPLSFTYPVQADWTTGILTGSASINGSDQLTLTGGGGGSGETVGGTSYSPGSLNIPASPNGVTGIGVRIIPGASGAINQVNFPIAVDWGGGSTNVVVRVALYSDSGSLPGILLASTTVSKILGFPGVTSWILGAINVVFNVTGGTPYWLVFEQDPSTIPNCVFNIASIDIASGSWSGGVNTYAQYTPHGSGACPGKPSSQTAWQPVEDSFSSGPIGNSSGSYTFAGIAVSGTWTSSPIDTGVGTSAFGIITAVQNVNGGTITYSTQSSPDGITWSGYTPLGPGGQITSPLNRYLQTQISLDVNSSSVAPLILDVTVHWVGGTGTPKYTPAPSAFTFAYNSNLVDISQELADNLGGDTSILNDITVQASPLLLAGANTDVTWQGTIGTPPVNISPTTPLTVAPGVYTFAPYIAGGMDTSRMSGANPPALSIATTATISWVFTQINPTLPVFQITVTVGGNITGLQLQGMSFSGSISIQAAAASSASSIQQFGDRKESIQNTWIVTFEVAQVIASTLLANYANPFSYIPSFVIQPTFSMQIGDRITVQDINLDLNGDYIVVGVEHVFSTSLSSAAVQTTGKLLAVPAGF